MHFEVEESEIELEDVGANCGKRIWFEGDGYETVIAATKGCCAIAMAMGKRVPPDPTRAIDFFDCNFDSNHNFEQFRTDDYPPDGYASVYFHPMDSTPSPWGNMGWAADGNFERAIRICHGTIGYHDNHEATYANRAPPRLRPVVFNESWGVSIHQTYANHEPTKLFSFLLGTKSHEERGFFNRVGAKIKSVDAIRTSPGVQQVYKMGKKVDILWWKFDYEHPIQKFDQQSGRWRGVVTAEIKESFFSTVRKEVFVE